MARIRSIHPEQWTDHAFLQCSMAARLLCLALRNVADDHGIFEWNPLDLKIRLMPVDPVDVGELLDELEQKGRIARYVAEGKLFGAIRNFEKFQKPRTPKHIHPLPSIPIAALFGLQPGPLQQNAETPAAEVPTTQQNASTGPLMEGNRREEEVVEVGGGRAEGHAADAGLAFAGRVIRLKQVDFDRWHRAYGRLDLMAELQSRDDWLADQPPDIRKRWFVSTSSHLANRNKGAQAPPATEGSGDKWDCIR